MSVHLQTSAFFRPALQLIALETHTHTYSFCLSVTHMRCGFIWQNCGFKIWLELSEAETLWCQFLRKFQKWNQQIENVWWRSSLSRCFSIFISHLSVSHFSFSYTILFFQTGSFCLSLASHTQKVYTESLPWCTATVSFSFHPVISFYLHNLKKKVSFSFHVKKPTFCLFPLSKTDTGLSLRPSSFTLYL